MEVKQTRIFELNDKLTRAMKVIMLATLFIIVLLVTIMLTHSQPGLKVLTMLLIGASISLLLAMIGYIRTARELAALDIKQNRYKNSIKSTYDPRGTSDE